VAPTVHRGVDGMSPVRLERSFDTLGLGVTLRMNRIRVNQRPTARRTARVARVWH